ncbi:hypothetical protein HWC44_gp050 [Mycobacterium phage ThetaBob]|uniref:Bro-N domain-containing protein n=1 Tax=Mycobacterium phage ThetaBob TaxID=2588513 RepID=A0A4Y6EPA7_9CAUD|nr:hypothetical protein HWC44_gp050 [Mycobacterium phage ThetaBob]QDF19937.1 hypothetical protein SEA_THETABOB_50 [Mycobacterium phage ThetaBob]
MTTEGRFGMSELQLTGDQSPFDAIRRSNPEGREYWSARELMPLLGYDKWERFDGAVQRAIASLIAQGHDANREASRLRESFGRTNQVGDNYHLSRFACYLVAMNGDPRKPEVAAAQAYFAIKTREAEVRPNSSFDLMRQMIDRLEEADRKAEEARAIAAKTDARLDAIEGRHDWYSALGYARLNGIPNTSTQFLNRVGRQASSIAKRHNIDAVKVPHQLFGEVNSYPAWVWEIAFAGFEAA